MADSKFQAEINDYEDFRKLFEKHGLDPKLDLDTSLAWHVELFRRFPYKCQIELRRPYVPCLELKAAKNAPNLEDHPS